MTRGETSWKPSARPQTRFGDGRNQVLRKQAKALEKQSSPDVPAIRKLKAEAKLAMAEAEQAAIAAEGWSAVKIKGFETEL